MRNVLGSVAVVLAGCAACTGGSGSPPPATGAPTGVASTPVVATAMQLCDAALHGTTRTARGTTLGEVRRTDFGGPAPGVLTGRAAFPGRPPGERAAWCWAPTVHPSPGEAGRSWTLYVAIAGGRAQQLFTLGGVGKPPVGPPSVP